MSLAVSKKKVVLLVSAAVAALSFSTVSANADEVNSASVTTVQNSLSVNNADDGAYQFRSYATSPIGGGGHWERRIVWDAKVQGYVLKNVFIY